MAGKAVRPCEAAVMSAAEMRTAEAMPAMSMTAAVSVASTMTPTMAAAVTASMAATAPGEHVARQRHRKDNDCNSDCPSDQGFLPREHSHCCTR